MPHARGDEPVTDGVVYTIEGICPTHVGMNRIAIIVIGMIFLSIMRRSDRAGRSPLPGP